MEYGWTHRKTIHPRGSRRLPVGDPLPSCALKRTMFSLLFSNWRYGTRGQAFGKSGDVIANLNRVIEDGSAVYLLSFSPDIQPDDKYHQLKVTRCPSGAMSHCVIGPAIFTTRSQHLCKTALPRCSGSHWMRAKSASRPIAVRQLEEPRLH